MAGHASTEFHLEIAHILFIDTVGYSKLLTKEQRELQNALNEIVHGSERFRSAEAAGKLIRLPTGDGMALVFGDSLESPIICAMEICRAIRDHPGFQLRMGIHSGPVTRLVDVNGQSNVAGGGVNMAERVMSCADANHILLSKRAADDLAEYELWRPYLHDLGDCEGKHGAKLSLVNFYSEEFGNPELPARFKHKQLAKASLANLRSRWGKIMVGVGLLLLGGVSLLYFLAHNSGRRTASANQQGAAVMPAAEKSIAVLPFENLSERKSDANFANGVHDEILTDLAKVSDLKVISRTSTMQYRTGMERNLREIGKALGAARVVEGSVQRDGQRVRVSVQLIDARSDTHLWAESYERDVADTFALESELAETIVAQLKAKLSPEEKAAIEEESTSDPLAHDLFLEANALITMPLFNVQGTQNLFEAADLLEKAVARDPNYFQAYCKLASVHDQIYLNGPDQTPARLALADAALKAAQRTLPSPNIFTAVSSITIVPGTSWSWPGVPCPTSHWFLSWPALSIAVRVTGMHRRAISCALWNSTRAIPIRCNSSRSVIITCAITRTKQRFWTVHWRSCLTMSACGSSGLEFPCIDALTRSRSTPRSTRSWPKTRRLPRDSPTNGIILRFASAMRPAWIAPWLPCPPPATAMPALFFHVPGAKRSQRAWSGAMRAHGSLSPPRVKRSREHCAIGLTTANPFLSSA
jgi:TolB-like protein